MRVVEEKKKKKKKAVALFLRFFKASLVEGAKRAKREGQVTTSPREFPYRCIFSTDSRASTARPNAFRVTLNVFLLGIIVIVGV